MQKSFSILATLMCLAICVTKAQQYVPKQTVQSIMHKIIIPEGGSLQEALFLTQDWTENILRKNDNIEEVQLLLSNNNSDTLDLLVLYKFKDDIERSTNEIIQELIKKRWPGENDFENFMKKLHAYIDPKLNQKSIYKELVLED